MKKKLLALLMAFVLLFAPLIARCEEDIETWTMYAICNDSHVNVRTRPSTKADIGGYLDFGWDIQVVGTTKDRSGHLWYKVTGITEQGYGYVYGAYLIDSQPERVDEYWYVEWNGRVALYNKINGKRKGWAKNGESLHVKIMSDEWALTDRGWVRTMYIAPDTSIYANFS